MPTGQYNRTEFHRQIIVKINKSKEHIEKVRKANTGKKFTEERKKNLSLHHADFNGEKNPNWRGDKVGFIGVHIWLKKYYPKTMICNFCGTKKTNPLQIDYALIKGKKHERKRENYLELCRSCHAKYDKKGFCK